jgi:hypothetical protein
MPVYEPVPAQAKADMLSDLLALTRSRRSDLVGPDPEIRDMLSPDLITNIRQFGYTASPRQLHAVSQNLNLTIGGAFKLFGYSLESMRELDFLLNGSRTRLIDSYPFYLDRPVDLPKHLGDASSMRRNSLLSDLVLSWRHEVPIRSIRGPQWSRRKILYAQVGTNDGMGLPRIPPGSFVAIREINEEERRKPDPERYYLLQHRTGYVCCRCTVDCERLLLISEGQMVGTKQEYMYPGEVRVVGRLLSLATRLPVPTQELVPFRASRSDTPLLLP